MVLLHNVEVLKKSHFHGTRSTKNITYYFEKNVLSITLMITFNVLTISTKCEIYCVVLFYIRKTFFSDCFFFYRYQFGLSEIKKQSSVCGPFRYHLTRSPPPLRIPHSLQCRGRCQWLISVWNAERFELFFFAPKDFCEFI